MCEDFFEKILAKFENVISTIIKNHDGNDTTINNNNITNVNDNDTTNITNTETNTNITEGADGSKLCIKFYLLFLLPEKSSICPEFF